MRVIWIAYNTVKMIDGQSHSRFASARYRVIAPVEGLIRLGHEATLVQIGVDDVIDRVVHRLDADIVVFSKLITPNHEVFGKLSATIRTLINMLHESGKRVVADLNDNYFHHPFYGAYFRDIVARADAIVTSTATMSGLIANYTSRPIVVIGDPFEGPRGEAQLCVPARCHQSWFTRPTANLGGLDDRLRLVWFGHESNWKVMREAVPGLLNLGGWKIDLEVITAGNCGVEEFCDAFNARHAAHCRLTFTPWTLDATWAGLSRAAMVLIPTWPDNPGKAVKGSNRLVESLRAGRFAVAGNLQAYQSLAQFCWLGDSLSQGVKWALENPERARQRVTKGQAFVECAYSPDTISRSWEQMLAWCGTHTNLTKNIY